MLGSEYFQLNEIVNNVFFDGRFQDVSVYLDIEDDVYHEISSKLNETKQDLDLYIGLVVSETLSWNEPNIYSWHQENLLRWKHGESTEAPPISALLLTFALGAERMHQGEVYSSNNYYRRLCEILNVRDSYRVAQVRSAGKYTLLFWKALNRWLTENDYAYGRPTARQVNSWKFVSYALSQSLVRDADRKRLHQMFSHFGLSSEEKLGESDISLYLHEWMSGYGPSKWLKKLWSSPDLRERIATAAVNELESWDGFDADGTENGPATKRLSWIATEQNFPCYRFSLYLAAKSTDHQFASDLNLEEGSTSLAEKAFGGGEPVWFSALIGTDMTFLDPVSRFSLDALLLTSFTLVNSGEGTRYSHDASPIIPLIKTEGSLFYKEVSRISLHVQHVVLCHESWKDRVSPYLDQYARSGYSIAKGSSTGGLPPEWVLIRGVELLGVPPGDVDNQIQRLVPLSEGTTIHYVGGFKLAPNMWHAKAPPDVFVTDDEGGLDVELRSVDIHSKARVIASQQASFFDPSFMSAADIDLESQNLVIAGLRGKRVKAEKDISFRSALTPRKNLPSRDIEVAYSFSNEQGGLQGFSASPDDVVEHEFISLTGMIFSGQAPVYNPSTLEGEHVLPSISYEEDEKQQGYNLETVHGFSETCILRGYHVWSVQPDSSSMTCKDCHAFQVIPSKARRKRKGKKTKDAVEPDSKVGKLVSTSFGKQWAITPDIVYDAICYFGSGTWRKLQEILSTIVEVPWRVFPVANELVDLGLIDLMRDMESMRPIRWSVSPPTLVLTQRGEAFFTGYRNERLIEELKTALDGLSSAFRGKKGEFVPTSYHWVLDDDSLEKLEDAIQHIVDPNGRLVKVVNYPAESIILSMPSVSEMIANLNPVHIDGDKDIEKFDPTTGKWRGSRLGVAGAYRAKFAGRRYFYHDGEVSGQGEIGLVKLLAARGEGMRLHNYNQQDESFECVIGCEPPGLFRRALVSCSGKLPLIEDGTIRYPDVPKKVAIILMRKLYL